MTEIVYNGGDTKTSSLAGKTFSVRLTLVDTNGTASTENYSRAITFAESPSSPPQEQDETGREQENQMIGQESPDGGAISEDGIEAPLPVRDLPKVYANQSIFPPESSEQLVARDVGAFLAMLEE